MSLNTLNTRHDSIVRTIHDSTTHAMHVTMLARDPDDLLANVKCFIEEDPETAREVLHAALEALAVSVESHAVRKKLWKKREGN